MIDGVTRWFRTGGPARWGSLLAAGLGLVFWGCGSNAFSENKPTSSGGEAGASGSPDGSQGGSGEGGAGQGGTGGPVAGSGGESGGSEPTAGEGGQGATGQGGAGTGGDGGSSGAPPEPCDRTAPFGTPRPLDELNSDSEEVRAWLTDDRLTVYFDSNRTGQFEIYRAMRDSVSEPFGPAEALPAPVNTGDWERNPVLADGGRTLFFSRGERDPNIYVATRPNLVAEFGTADLVAGINSTGEDWAASISGDGELFFFCAGPRFGNYEAYMARRTSGGGFQEPVAVGELNSAQPEYEPIITPDALVVYVASERPGAETQDILRAHRSTRDDGFGPLELEDALSSPSRESASWVSSDECTIVIGSDRPSAKGGWNLFIAERP